MNNNRKRLLMWAQSWLSNCCDYKTKQKEIKRENFTTIKICRTWTTASLQQSQIFIFSKCNFRAFSSKTNIWTVRTIPFSIRSFKSNIIHKAIHAHRILKSQIRTHHRAPAALLHSIASKTRKKLLNLLFYSSGTWCMFVTPTLSNFSFFIFRKFLTFRQREATTTSLHLPTAKPFSLFSLCSHLRRWVSH